MRPWPAPWTVAAGSQGRALGRALAKRLAALAWGLGLAAAAGLAAPWAAAEEGAQPGEGEGAQEAASVDRFHGVLIEAMQAGAFEARQALLEPAVAQFFDLASIARISVGASWRGLPDAERRAFIDLLGRLVVATYADRFDSYGGQRFKRVGMTTASTGRVVKSQLIRANGEPVNLDYYFRGAKVFNVVADGVSDLSLRRADYASIIRQQGFPALVEHLKADIAEAGAAAP